MPSRKIDVDLGVYQPSHAKCGRPPVTVQKIQKKKGSEIMAALEGIFIEQKFVSMKYFHGCEMPNQYNIL